MPMIPNIEAANNSGFLWPSISDAVDTFLRRRHNNAAPYERVWRLIHLWEAAEITLSLADVPAPRRSRMCCKFAETAGVLLWKNLGPGCRFVQVDPGCGRRNYRSVDQHP